MTEDNFSVRSDVSYYVHSYELWHDLGVINKRKNNEESLSAMFQTCLMSKCYTFLGERLYICPRAAHGERLGFLKNKNDEVVEFGKDFNITETKGKLIEFINRSFYINACNYCNGSSNESKTIKSAIQID